MLDLIAYAVGVVSLYLLVQAIRPLIESGEVTAEDWDRIDDETSALLAKRDRLVDELRDLEFEAAMHKVGDRDLAALRAQFERRALDIEAELAVQTERYSEKIDADVDAKIADAQSKAAARKAGPVVPAADVKIEAKPASSTKPEGPLPAKVDISGVVATPPPEPSEDPCGSCGSPLGPNARFCDECGTSRDVACPSCAELNRAGAKFCKACGEGLQAEEEAS